MHTRHIFLHQVKTAGKTVEKFLLRKFGEKYRKTTLIFKDESLGNIFDILSATDSDKLTELNKATAISGHFPYGLHELIDGPCRYFTLLRNPVSRVRSFYAYSLKNEGSKIHRYLTENDISFEQFVQMEKADIEKSGVHELNYVLEDGQAKIVAGEDLLIGEGKTDHLLEQSYQNIAKDFDFVGVTEMFDDSFIEITKSLGFGKFNLYITQNRSTVKVNVSDNVKKIVEQRNPVDMALHGKYLNEMQNISGSMGHVAAKTYLKYGSAAADLYVKLRS